MIPYIGDISKNDAIILRNYTQSSKSILEFGCGASTQVIAEYMEDDAQFTSIDTSTEWINKTMENLSLLNIVAPGFWEYNDFMNNLTDQRFDFVFDDGVDALRRDFAIRIWPYIEPGGVLAFHDTRRGHDFRNVLEVLAVYQNEVDLVFFNAGHSNITMVRKKVAEPYDNWQISESRQPWQLGYGDPPQEFIDSLKK